MSMSQYVDAWESPMLVLVDGVKDTAQEVAGNCYLFLNFVIKNGFLCNQLVLGS